MLSSMPIGDLGAARQRLEAGEIVRRQRLLDEQQLGVARALDIAARRRKA